MFRLVPFLFVLTLFSSCGFTAVNSPESHRALAQIHVAPIAERSGQALNTALRAQFDPNGLNLTRAYTLDLVVSTQVSQSFLVDTGVRRARGTMIATGTLIGLDQRVLWSGSFSESSFLAQHELPSLSLEAQETLWVQLADLIAREAATEFSGLLIRSNQIIAVP